jgi:hypothetical protein
MGAWGIVANGFTGTLQIDSVDFQGNLAGSVFGQPLTGFWDEPSQTITFLRVPPEASGNASVIQVYRGCLFQQEVSTLSGTFLAFAGTGGTASRNEFGWFAQIG